jgi:FdhE protein
LAESPAARLGCLTCGEQRVEALPVYRAEATDPARIDACDSCRVYVKTVDLTRDGEADPVADDVASVSLDLWARERGYRRLRLNLLRL